MTKFIERIVNIVLCRPSKSWGDIKLNKKERKMLKDIISKFKEAIERVFLNQGEDMTYLVKGEENFKDPCEKYMYRAYIDRIQAEQRENGYTPCFNNIYKPEVLDRVDIHTWCANCKYNGCCLIYRSRRPREK